LEAASLGLRRQQATHKDSDNGVQHVACSADSMHCRWHDKAQHMHGRATAADVLQHHDPPTTALAAALNCRHTLSSYTCSGSCSRLPTHTLAGDTLLAAAHKGPSQALMQCCLPSQGPTSFQQLQITTASYKAPQHKVALEVHPTIAGSTLCRTQVCCVQCTPTNCATAAAPHHKFTLAPAVDVHRVERAPHAHHPQQTSSSAQRLTRP
jgi:hypothetical protein